MSKFRILNFSRKIRVVLVGGLGNQLFTYTAGLVMALTQNKELVVDCRRIPHGFTNHEVSISSFRLKGLFLTDAKNHDSLRILLRFENIFISRFILGRKIASALGFYFSKVVGFDEDLMLNPKIHVMNGYFQSFKYFDSLESKFKLELDFTSEWYKSHESRALVEKPIALHVRRGDYKQLSNNFGCLSAEYYVEAIRIARQFAPTQSIWVFSDDIENSTKLLAGLKIENLEFIDDSRSGNAAESLKLMSLASANIIANSTFSWWAATLNQNKGLVVAPDKWFKGLEDPKDLIPPDWILVKSQWE